MNLISAIIFFIAIVVAVNCQCPQRPAQPTCGDDLHGGHTGTNCYGRTMWWYDRGTNNCMSFPYRGCGGTRNRHCSRAECLRLCRV
ncbi:mambaquaretin-9-like [Stomoxys calcitrans]|uniref:mambaquaretin-9-like n=1 Tax=Stomoxys calcitrans TaxID=35570 RepID=UPI0027E3182F|nr:mambaquaretin-9-like [Stomoxys calcitrans]